MPLVFHIPEVKTSASVQLCLLPVCSIQVKDNNLSSAWGKICSEKMFEEIKIFGQSLLKFGVRKLHMYIHTILVKVIASINTGIAFTGKKDFVQVTDVDRFSFNIPLVSIQNY